ncbi:WPP domain-interacting tail-anchored protein 2-like [Carica papaya]|uniref:WPP domain-interacting tail-anchored protein 2-like n=1 Tax=Carica papaya TaxID=3649 RepID=UPI000B8CEBAF|nr:WPP domain-interacting tail-anchored protein 2-like [Carica papaya]
MHRDFTINSLFFDPFSNKIYDYTNGMADIKSLKLQTLVPAHFSFKEDCARILRGLRIAARLGLSLSKDIESAIHDLSSSIESLGQNKTTGMDDLTVGVLYTNHEELDKVNLHEEVQKNGMKMQPADDAMKFLAAVDFDLSYSSEKLVNLHLLLMHLLVWNNDLEAMAMGDSLSLEISVEKALVFDLLSGILDSELQEFSRFLDALRAHIFYASHKISSCRHSKELFVIMEETLHDSEESLRHSQEQFLEIKMQLAELQRSFSYFKDEKRKKDEVVELSGNDQLFDSCATWKKQTTLQHRHVLRTLEKSFSMKNNC